MSHIPTMAAMRSLLVDIRLALLPPPVETPGDGGAPADPRAPASSWAARREGPLPDDPRGYDPSPWLLWARLLVPESRERIG